MNIAGHLPRVAAERPDALAVACPDRRGGFVEATFRQLDDRSDAIARGLLRSGVSAGERAAVLVKPGHDFFALTFALFKAGVVPVLIDPGIGVRNFGRCLAEAEPSLFFGIPPAILARKLLGWGRATIRRIYKVGPAGPMTLDGLAVLGREGAPTLHEPSAEEIAAILFTSGSTGPPKGAIYTHEIFNAQVEILRSTYDIEPGEIDLCTFPLFALFAPALGMSAIVPEMDATRPGRADPRRIIDTIRGRNVTTMFGSPALIRRVADYGREHKIKLATLRRAISAGAPVPAKVIERFASLLPENVQIHTPYGATEALPVATIGSELILGRTRAETDRGRGVCVGRPVEGMRVEVIRIDDGPIAAWSDALLAPAGEVGELVVRGPVVTGGYYRRPEADALSKIIDPADGSTWHRMGDLGRRDVDGLLWFYGRKSHRVVTPDRVYYTIAVEAVFNTVDGVARTALVGVDGPSGRRPVLCVESTLEKSHRRKLIEELRVAGSRYDHTREVDIFLFHPGFPVDIRHNAKIRRETLAIWAARKLR